MNIITINVSGKMYQIPRETLLKIPYFARMIEDCQDTSEIFVNRSSMMFDHIIALIIDPLHPYPVEYRYELDFYCIEYDVDQLYVHDQRVIEEIAITRHESSMTLDNQCKLHELSKINRCAYSLLFRRNTNRQT